MKNDLKKGKIVPYTGDEKNHIVIIVCGKGNHSFYGPVLKFEIPEFLISQGYDIYTDENNGVVFVRMKCRNIR